MLFMRNRKGGYVDKYEIKFYKNDKEVDIEELPDDYVNGIAQLCKDEIVSRGRMNRVCSNMADNIHQD